MASQTQGIQQLLAAEKRAAEKVGEARKSKFFLSIFSIVDLITKIPSTDNIFYILRLGKQRRLKQAKEEAQEEIERYRLERDRQFKEFEAKVNFLINSYRQTYDDDDIWFMWTLFCFISMLL